MLNDFAVAITGGNADDVDVEAAVRAIQSKNPEITKVDKKKVTSGKGDKKKTETILYVYKKGRRFPITLGSSTGDTTETITMNEAMNQVATLLGIPKAEVQPSIDLWNANNEKFVGKIDFMNDFSYSQQTEIGRQDINNLKVGEESLTQFLANHQKNNENTKGAQRVNSSKRLVQTIQPLLRYVDTDKQMQTLDLQVDSSGSIKAGDIVILDSTTGLVNTGNLQAAINKAQIEAGSFTDDPTLTNFSSADLGGSQ